MASAEVSLQEQKRVLTNNREFIVEYLDADDVIDELIQENMMGRNARQRVQLVGMSRMDKNRIIVDQLSIAGPGTLEKFCGILRKNKRQMFIAKELEKCVHLTASECERISIKPNIIDVSRLQARYLRYLSTDWPHYYVRLALVKRDRVTRADKDLKEITRITLQGQPDDILFKKENLGELRNIFHYQNLPCPRLIVIMGSAGIGKTTLANEICVQWAMAKNNEAKGNSYLAEDFDIVILIPLRSVQHRLIEEVMIEHAGEEIYEHMKKLAGRRSLLILEGLDEMTSERRETDPFLIRVVRDCTLLEKATIIITSRPHACVKLDAGRRIEVVGFGKKEIQEFVERSFHNDIRSVHQFLQQFKEYPHLESLSYVPMNLVMIVDIFKCNESKLPSTITQLYQLFTVMTLERQIRKKKEQECSVAIAAVPTNSAEDKLHLMLAGVPKKAMKTLLLLCRLAYHGFFGLSCKKKGIQMKQNESKIIFTVADLNLCGIKVTAEWDGYGLLKATHTHQLPTDTIIYNFLHLTIQEFLCAAYISTLLHEEQQHLLSEHFTSYPNIFQFLCGLTHLESSKMFQFVFSKLLLEHHIDFLTAVKCLYESQCTSPPSDHLVTPITLSIDNTVLPYECLCISHLLSYYPISKLIMWGCQIGDKGAELLGKLYFDMNTTSQFLKILKFTDNDFSICGLAHILSIVETSKFHYCCSCRYIGKVTKPLCLWSTITITGRASLQQLDISDNPIGDDGITLLLSKLQYCNTLSTLVVSWCKFSMTGAICISKNLRKCSLQILDMSWNDIGNDGITAIAEALSNSQIRELSVRGCEIALTGARALGAGLLVKNKVKLLDVRDNPITVEGASVILRAAVNNRVCEAVMIDDKYNREINLHRLKIILEHRKKKKSEERRR